MNNELVALRKSSAALRMEKLSIISGFPHSCIEGMAHECPACVAGDAMKIIAKTQRDAISRIEKYCRSALVQATTELHNQRNVR